MGDRPGPVKLSTDYIGRYRGKVSPTELAYIQAHAGKGMRRYGYERAQVEMGRGERLRYALFDSPDQSLRRLAWRVVEESQQRLPGLVPRRPGSRMALDPGAGDG